MLQYVVQPGDTIYFIALKFNVTVQIILEINKIKNPNAIFSGKMLQIPLPMDGLQLKKLFIINFISPSNY